MLQQLRLVKDAPTHAITPPSDAIGRVFDHWLFMFGKSPRMCKLTTARRRLVGAWLTVYGADGEEVLRWALDGAYADAFIAERGGQFTSLEWILRDEANIERYAEAGEQIHREIKRADEEDQHARAATPQAVSPEQAAADRERVRQWAARRRGRSA